MKSKRKILFFEIIVLLILWQIAAMISNSPFIVSPIIILNVMRTTFPELMVHLGVSALRVFGALSIALLCGVLCGALMVQKEMITKYINPLLYMLYPIPKVAFLPLLMLVFGIGELPKLVLLTSIIIFQFTFSTLQVLEDVNRDYGKTMYLLNLSAHDRFREVYFPALIPTLIVTIKNTFGISLAVLFFAENFATQAGMGFYIMNMWMTVQYPEMIAGIVLMSVFGFAVADALDRLQRLLCPWLD